MDELRTSLHRIIQDYGFSGFAFVDAGRPELDLPYYIGTFPPAWERTYIQNDFVRSDPALARSRRTNTPFHWGSLKLPERQGRKRPPEVRTMDAAREYGFKEGFVVPFHYRDRTRRHPFEFDRVLLGRRAGLVSEAVRLPPA